MSSIKQFPIKEYISFDLPKDELSGGQLTLNEIVRRNETLDDINSLKTVINGKRDVGFIHLTKEYYKMVVKYNIGVIPVRMVSQNSMMAIIYRDKSKAQKLHVIAMRHNGYLDDNSPIEAREIGRLLGYNENDIEKYVHNKYDKKVPIRTDTPDDYDDLHEQKLETFAKQIEKDNKNRKLDKEILYTEDDFKVCAVNGDFVRDSDTGLNFNQFVDGGHHYVTSYPGYKKHIPEDEIWIDDVFRSKPHDLSAIILHEKLERYLMKYHGMSYDDAHSNHANPAEEKFRKIAQDGFNEKIQKEIYNEFVKKYEDEHKKKKLNEDFQFNEIKNLMQKII